MDMGDKEGKEELTIASNFANKVGHCTSLVKTMSIRIGTC